VKILKQLKMSKKWIILCLLSMIWGTSFILIKKGLIGLTPFQVGALRIIFAGLFIIPLGLKGVLKLKLVEWKHIIVTAILGTFIPAFLFAIAQTQVSSSISAVLNSLTPLNTLWVGFVWFGMLFNRNQLIGIIIGFSGSLILVLNASHVQPTQNYWFAIFVVIATLCYAVNVNYMKKNLPNLKPLTITAGNFSILIIPAFLILFFTNYFEVCSNVKVYQSTLFILILGIICTAIANVLFFKLLQLSTPLFASSVTYLIPVVAMLWGIYFSEKLTEIQVLASILILFGIYVSTKKLK
jgi:drug/metabolite transporter (DMT)-like permease